MLAGWVNDMNMHGKYIKARKLRQEAHGAASGRIVPCMVGSCLAIVALVCMSAAVPALAATVGAVETWDVAGDALDWKIDTTRATLSNPGGYLDVAFRTIYGPPAPDVANIYTMTNKYTGNFVAAGVTHVSFMFMAKSVQPSAVRLCFKNAATGREWHKTLSAPAVVGQWTNYAVRMADYAGWVNLAGGSESEYLADITNVTWIGVQILRSGGTDAEHYLIDEFVLLDYDDGTDSDDDGMTDYAEKKAGTDPDDPASYLSAKMELQSNSGNGIVLKWNSAAGRTYSILRSSEMTGVFTPVASGILATIPVNSYEDSTATGSGPYFYKILVE